MRGFLLLFLETSAVESGAWEEEEEERERERWEERERGGRAVRGGFPCGLQLQQHEHTAPRCEAVDRDQAAGSRTGAGRETQKARRFIFSVSETYYFLRPR